MLMPKLLRVFVPLLALILLCVQAQATEPGAATVRGSQGPSAGRSATAGDDFLASLNYEEDAAEKDPEQPLYVTALSFLFKLALVLALAYVSILGLKKWSGMKGGLPARGGAGIKVVESAALGSNRSLHLVAVGSRRLLVGSTQAQVNLIAEVDPNEFPEPAVAEPGATFGDHLSRFLGTRTDASGAETNVSDALRESTAFLRDKVREVGGLRRNLRDDHNTQS